MANLIHSAKSASDWTLDDLDSYHISLNQMDPLAFFGLKELPQPSVDPELLSNVGAQDMQQDRHAELLNYLDLAMTPNPEDGETAVNDFTFALFRILGYSHHPRLTRTQVHLQISICGESRDTKTDVCIVNLSQNAILLLVQEDKKFVEKQPDNVRAQLVAEAVGAFIENKIARELIELAPVSYCYPAVPRPARRDSEGMRPLDNRREILRCFEAFKAILGI